MKDQRARTGDRAGGRRQEAREGEIRTGTCAATVEEQFQYSDAEDTATCSQETSLRNRSSQVPRLIASCIDAGVGYLTTVATVSRDRTLDPGLARP